MLHRRESPEALEGVASSISEIPDRISSYRDNDPSLSSAICQVGRAVRDELSAQAAATDRLAAAMERIATVLEQKQGGGDIVASFKT